MSSSLRSSGSRFTPDVEPVKDTSPESRVRTLGSAVTGGPIPSSSIRSRGLNAPTFRVPLKRGVARTCSARIPPETSSPRPLAERRSRATVPLARSMSARVETSSGAGPLVSVPPATITLSARGSSDNTSVVPLKRVSSDSPASVPAAAVCPRDSSVAESFGACNASLPSSAGAALEIRVAATSPCASIPRARISRPSSFAVSAARSRSSATSRAISTSPPGTPSPLSLAPPSKGERR